MQCTYYSSQQCSSLQRHAHASTHHSSQVGKTQWKKAQAVHPLLWSVMQLAAETCTCSAPKTGVSYATCSSDILVQCTHRCSQLRKTQNSCSPPITVVGQQCSLQQRRARAAQYPPQSAFGHQCTHAVWAPLMTVSNGTCCRDMVMQCNLQQRHEHAVHQSRQLASQPHHLQTGMPGKARSLSGYCGWHSSPCFFRLTSLQVSLFTALGTIHPVYSEQQTLRPQLLIWRVLSCPFLGGGPNTESFLPELPRPCPSKTFVCFPYL